MCLYDDYIMRRSKSTYRYDRFKIVASYRRPSRLLSPGDNAAEDAPLTVYELTWRFASVYANKFF